MPAKNSQRIANGRHDAVKKEPTAKVHADRSSPPTITGWLLLSASERIAGLGFRCCSSFPARYKKSLFESFPSPLLLGDDDFQERTVARLVYTPLMQEHGLTRSLPQTPANPSPTAKPNEGKGASSKNDYDPADLDTWFLVLVISRPTRLGLVCGSISRAAAHAVVYSSLR